MVRYGVVVLLGLTAACQEHRVTGPEQDQQPQMAKGGKVDTQPRVNLVWAEQVLIGDAWEPAGIRGDGRLKDGSPSGTSANEYQGNYCGVYGVIAGTDANMDPDALYAETMQASCGPARHYNFYLNLPEPTPSPLMPHHRSFGITGLAVGGTRIQPGGFGIQIPNCSPLMFDDQYPPASSMRQIRLPDVVVNGATARQWRVESQGSHRAMCMTTSRGKSVPTGVTHYLPFSVTITEVPYPYPTFP